MQLKILCVAVMWWFVFKKPILTHQWLGLLVLMIGSGLVSFQNNSGASNMYVTSMGLFYLSIQIFLSGCAGKTFSIVFHFVTYCKRGKKSPKANQDLSTTIHYFAKPVGIQTGEVFI